METSEKNNVIELEHRISQLIKNDNNCSVHFNYDVSISGLIRVDSFTFNPKNKETFLLKSVTGIHKIDCLNKIIKYLELLKDSMAPYTIEWSKRGIGDSTHSSYFYCHNPLEALETFYAGKEKEEYVIYQVKLNPIA